ncbi:phospholipase D family protein [Glutamicibacter creatinolyticus]|uniref:phospholipase D family protein n=1 Tax=Glutamicibacter creatinolyticus TaxID=162496 RepID=UPI0031DBF372
MRLQFAGQPFSGQPNLIDFINHVKGGGFDELKIAVAWAKRSGLGRLWDELEEFRANGGKVLLILGVSEGGATKEGLEMALQISDQSYVFHDPRRTFHPKVYFASSGLGARSLFVGSSNLTAGGLSWNYEASMWVDWKAGEGHEVTDVVSNWFDNLIAQRLSCSPLSVELIKDLEQSGDIIIGSETRARRVQKKKSDTPEDNDSAIVATVSGLFKPIFEGLRKLPSLSSKITTIAAAPGANTVKKPLSSGKNTSSTLATAKSPALAGPAPLSTNDVQRRWFKLLDNTAAQQVKSSKSNPTGNLRLSRESAAIDHTVYFREDFFGGLPWAPTEGKDSEQEVVVGFHTWIDGTDFGTQELRVSHDPARISGQGNVPTVLHWGELSPVLRQTNYVGLYVSLERTTNDEYNLVVSQNPRGNYMI